MDNETREFLSQSRRLVCDKCNSGIKVSLKDLGTVIICPNCGNKIFLLKEIYLKDFSPESKELKEAAEEFLKER